MRRRGALAVPNFRAYFVSAAFAQCGGWLLRTTQAWLVLDLTGSPAALGLIIVAQSLPVTIFTLFSGVLIDRMHTRRLMIVEQLIFFGQAAVMAVLTLTGQIQYWQVIVLAAVLGVASAVDFPARSAIVSELLEPAQVGNGIALNSALNSAARIIGPGLGGLLVAVWGSGAGFTAGALAYLAATAVMLTLRSDQFLPKRFAPPRNLLRQLVEGLRYSFSTPLLSVNMILAGFFGTFAYNWALVLPLLARFILDLGAEGFGALNVAMGIGSTLGAFALVTRMNPSMRLLLTAATVFAASLFALAHVPNLPVALAVLVVTGFLSTAFNATNNTLIQVEAREELRGRVLSLFMFLMVGSTPVGSAVTSLVANTVDVRAALQLSGTLCLIGVAVAALVLWRARTQPGVVDAVGSGTPSSSRIGRA